MTHLIRSNVLIIYVMVSETPLSLTTHMGIVFNESLRVFFNGISFYSLDFKTQVFTGDDQHDVARYNKYKCNYHYLLLIQQKDLF